MILNYWSEIIFATIVALQNVCSQDFSYLGAYGPDHWGEQFTACSGKQQSPINIELVRAKNVSLPPLSVTGFDEPPKSAVLQNNGHTVVVTMDFQQQPTISGGPLNDSYALAQFHFHWGDDDDQGSEDLINNHSFPVELHMVFFNKKYYEFNKATNYVDGLVVLAYFFKISNEVNLAYVGLSLLLERIVTPDHPIKYAYVPKLENLVSNNFQNYFTYTGSLTTPPCSEVVIWIDFETPIPITSEQIKNFRNLRTKDDELLTHNYRPIQPLNGRVIYRNVPEMQDNISTLTFSKQPFEREDYLSNNISSLSDQASFKPSKWTNQNNNTNQIRKNSSNTLTLICIEKYIVILVVLLLLNNHY